MSRYETFKYSCLWVQNHKYQWEISWPYLLKKVWATSSTYKKHIIHYEIRKGAVSCYLLSFWKTKTCLRVNWISKMLVQFCWVRIYLGVETVSCCLLQGIARTDMDWNFKKLCQLFQVLMLCLQKSSKKYWLVFLDEICLI